MIFLKLPLKSIVLILLFNTCPSYLLGSLQFKGLYQIFNSYSSLELMILLSTTDCRSGVLPAHSPSIWYHLNISYQVWAGCNSADGWNCLGLANWEKKSYYFLKQIYYRVSHKTCPNLFSLISWLSDHLELKVRTFSNSPVNSLEENVQYYFLQMKDHSDN